MGRIKSTSIKTIGDKLIEKHAGKFSTDFDKNKEVLKSVQKIESKKIRNVVAGYISKKMKKVNK